MKRISQLLLIIVSIIGLLSCEDKIGTVINSAALDGSLTFQLNKTQYNDWVYVLDNANADQSIDALTCKQPDYGFPAVVSYTVQVCFDSKFAANTFAELPTAINGEIVTMNTKEMNKAMIKLYGGKLPDPIVVKSVYVRLKAIVSDATSSPLDTVQTVKPLYSNAVTLKIQPYVLPLLAYTEVTPVPYYIIGLADGLWNNSASGIGSSVIPMGVVAGKQYDLSGNGEFVYTGYIKASQTFKLIRDLGSYTEQWGNSGQEGIGNPVHNDGNAKNFKVPADGYYTIKLNSIDNTVSITSISTTPTSYASVGLIGDINGWGADVALTPVSATNNHDWYVSYTFTNASGQVKLRANGSWDANWGTPSGQDGDPLYSLYGVGTPGGKNIGYTAGKFVIVLNDITGCYYFFSKK